MDLTKILSISGRPGLYKHVAQSRKGIVIESLEDGSGSTAFPSEHVSSLQDIAIFTTGEDKPLYEVFQAIYRHEDGKPTISHKSSASELKKYFEEVLPEYDQDRVYVSNIKRVLQWYNILLENDLIDLESPEDKEDDKSEENDKADKADDTDENKSNSEETVETEKKADDKEPEK